MSINSVILAEFEPEP